MNNEEIDKFMEKLKEVKSKILKDLNNDYCQEFNDNKEINELIKSFEKNKNDLKKDPYYKLIYPTISLLYTYKALFCLEYYIKNTKNIVKDVENVSKKNNKQKAEELTKIINNLKDVILAFT